MATIRISRSAQQTSGWLGSLGARVFASRRRFATGAAALLAMALGYHVVFGQNGLTAYQKKRADTQTLERQMNDLQRENDAMQGHVERLQHDPSAIEHQARQELHYTRPGEVIITLPPDPAKP
jgi:cell division protein FtsB